MRDTGSLPTRGGGIVVVVTEHAFDRDRAAPKLVAIATSVAPMIPRSGEPAAAIKAAHARAAIAIRSTVTTPLTAAVAGHDIERMLVRVTVDVEIRSIRETGDEKSIWAGTDTETRASADEAYKACVERLEPQIRAAIAGVLPELTR